VFPHENSTECKLALHSIPSHGLDGGDLAIVKGRFKKGEWDIGDLKLIGHSHSKIVDFAGNVAKWASILEENIVFVVNLESSLSR
jgi:hypothetical protein